MAALNSEQVNELIDLLSPHCDGSPAERTAMLEQALGFDHPALQDISYGENTGVYITGMVRRLHKFGKRDDTDPDTVLWALMRSLIPRMGASQVRRVMALEAALNRVEPEIARYPEDALLPQEQSEAPPDQPVLFISYARANLRIAQRIARDLHQRGIPIWIDKEGLTTGTIDWEDSLRDAIRIGRGVLLLASPSSRASTYVRDEIAIARMEGKPVYPLWIEGSQWIDAIPMGMGSAQYLDARGATYSVAIDQMAAILLGSAPSFLSEATEPEPDDSQREPARNPFKGLRAFETEDQQDFYGRDLLIETMITQLDAYPPFLALIGASGSGKSSVMMAGLLPRLRTANPKWEFIERVRPGEHPIERLAEALATYFPQKGREDFLRDLNSKDAQGLHWLARQIAGRRGGRVVLYIDQFEEIFTLTKSTEECSQFINLLTNAAGQENGIMTIMLSMRADFFHYLLDHPMLCSLVDAHKQIITSGMTVADLFDVVEKPSKQVGLTYDDGLIRDIVYEVRDAISPLPLLQFTLDQLYERRDGCRLTREAYDKLGGVRGALAQHAEDTHNGLPTPTHQELARSLFMRLIEPGANESALTRRRAPLSSLILAESGTFALPAEFSKAETTRVRASATPATDALAAEAAAPDHDKPTPPGGVGRISEEAVERARQRARIMGEVWTAFVNARLLTTGREGDFETIEISHEAIIREWDRLKRWILTERENIRLQNKIAREAAEWRERGGLPEDDGLYRGGMLAEARQWASLHDHSRDEEAFIAAGEGREQRDYQEKARQIAELRKAQEDAEQKAAALQTAQVENEKTALVAYQAKADADRTRRFASRANLALAGLIMVGLIVGVWVFFRIGDVNNARNIANREREAADTRVAVAETSVGNAQVNMAAAAQQLADSNAAVETAGAQLATAEAAALTAAAAVEQSNQLAIAANYNMATAVVLANTADAQAVTANAQVATAGTQAAIERTQAAIDATAAAGTLAAVERLRETANADQQQARIRADDAEEDAASALGNLRSAERDLNSASTAQAVQATAQAAVDEARRLADAAEMVESDGEAALAALLAVRSLNTVPNLSAVQVLSEVEDRLIALEFAGHTDSINDLVYTATGRYLMTASEDGTVRVWDAVSGAPLRILTLGSDARPVSLALSPDNRVLYAGASNGHVYGWDFTSDTPLYDWEAGKFAVQVVTAPDGTLATGDLGGIVRTWSSAGVMQTQWQAFSRTGEESAVHDLAFSPDGGYLLGGTYYGDAILWNAASGAEQRRYTGGTWEIYSVAFFPNTNRILIGGWDRKVSIFTIDSPNQPLYEIPFGAEIRSLVVARDGGSFAVATTYGGLSVFDSGTYQRLEQFTGDDFLRVAAFQPDSKAIITGGIQTISSDGVTLYTAHLWRLPQTQLETVRRAQTNGVEISGMALSPDAAQVAYAGVPGRGVQGETLEYFSYQWNGNARDAAFSPDGSAILFVGGDGLMEYVESQNGLSLAQNFPLDATETLNSAAIAPGGRYALTASTQRGALLWDLQNGELVRRYQQGGEAALHAVFLPNGEQLLVVTDQPALVLWDLVTAVPLREWRVFNTLEREADQVQVALQIGLAVSPDGRFALTGSEYGEVWRWDLTSAVVSPEAFRVGSAETRVVAVAISTDGRQFAAAAGNEVVLHAFETGRRVVFELAAPTDVEFSRDGTLLFAATFNGVVQAWPLSSGETALDNQAWIRLICARLRAEGRDEFTEAELISYRLSAAQATCPDEAAELAAPTLALTTAPTAYPSLVPLTVTSTLALPKTEVVVATATIDPIFASATAISVLGTPSSLPTFTASATLPPVTLAVTPFVGNVPPTQILATATASPKPPTTLVPPTPIVTATPIAALQAAVMGDQIGEIPVAGGQTWNYTAAAGESVVIRVLADKPAGTATTNIERQQRGLLDPIVTVYDAAGNVVGENDDDETADADAILRTNSRLELFVVAAGAYTIVVRGWDNGSAGVYTLRLEPPSEATAEATAPLDAGMISTPTLTPG